MGYMRPSRVYEPIYTVKKLYNDFIIKDFFLRENTFVLSFISESW